MAPAAALEFTRRLPMQLSHCVTTLCDVPAEHAFAFLADPSMLGSWALGCWDAVPIDAETVRGASLFDRSSSVVQIAGRADQLTVDYLVEDDHGLRASRICARVVPGPAVGRGAEQCLITVLAWRTMAMTDERWACLVASHDVEILLLKERVETATHGGDAR